MWALIKDNEIDHIISHPKSMVIDDITHPRAIFTAWTEADKQAIGIYSVIEPSHAASKFHYESNVVYTFNEEQQKVIGTIETVYDYELEDRDSVDEDGNLILDDHDNPVADLGLKSIEVAKVKLDAANSIKPYAWLIQRKVTADKDIPEVVLIYITNVREKCEEICTALRNANNMTEFKQIFENEKRHDFPDDYYVKGYRR